MPTLRTPRIPSSDTISDAELTFTVNEDDIAWIKLKLKSSLYFSEHQIDAVIYVSSSALLGVHISFPNILS